MRTTRLWNDTHKVRTRRKIGKPTKLTEFGRNKSKGINRIVIIGYGHLYLVEENLSFNTKWMKQLPQTRYGQMGMG
jgi:hypothetical protein